MWLCTRSLYHFKYVRGRHFSFLLSMCVWALSKHLHHKVFTYNRVQSSVWRLPNYWPPTPSPPSECVLPSHQRRWGRYTLAGRWGGGGLIFWKTPDIGLASYSIIPLRLTYFSIGDWFVLYQMSKNLNKRFFAEFLALLSVKVKNLVILNFCTFFLQVKKFKN